MAEAVHSFEDFQPMFKARQVAQRKIQEKIVLFNSAVCNSNKNAIIKDTMIYDMGWTSFVFAVAYGSCEKLADKKNKKEQPAEKKSTIRYMHAINKHHEERNGYLETNVLKKLSRLRQVVRPVAQRP